VCTDIIELLFYTPATGVSRGYNEGKKQMTFLSGCKNEKSSLCEKEKRDGDNGGGETTAMMMRE
jgi:hypothetical protein